MRSPRCASRVGSIVNTSSIAATGGGATLSIYTASKDALDAIVRAFGDRDRPRWYSHKRRQSGCYRYSFLTSALPPEAVTALGCIGHPDDIAGAATWLSSPEAAFVTSQSILVDSGYNIGGMG
jgi:NAD(P)-dependent dehydrogenase (short-subunit alcohol dehydrogenase family)